MNGISRALVLLALLAVEGPMGLAQDDGGEPRQIPLAALGAAVGTPAGLSLVGGVNTGCLSLKGSGGYWGRNWNGAQVDLGWSFHGPGALAQGPSIIAGMFRVSPRVVDSQGASVLSVRQNRYVGLAYEARYGGFFLQAGVGAGSGDYPNPLLLFQAGYLIAIP